MVKCRNAVCAAVHAQMKPNGLNSFDGGLSEKPWHASCKYGSAAMRRIERIGAAVVAVLAFSSAPSPGAQEKEPEVLLDEVQHGFSIAFDVRFSELNGDFANFVGLYGGWLIDHRFLLGVGGYGKTNAIDRSQMGYGGLVLEYFFQPERLWNPSVKMLVGGGGISWNWTDPFFVAEPEARMNLNLSRRWRLSFGGGYRFVGGAPGPKGAVSGFAAVVAVKFGSF